MVSLKGMGKGVGRGVAKGTDAVISADLAAPAKCVQMRVRTLNQGRKARKAMKEMAREQLTTLLAEVNEEKPVKATRRNRKAQVVVEATAS